MSELTYPSAAEVERRKRVRSAGLTWAWSLLVIGAICGVGALLMSAISGMCVGSYDQWPQLINDDRRVFSMWPLGADCAGSTENQHAEILERWEYTVGFYGGSALVLVAVAVFIATTVRTSKWRL